MATRDWETFQADLARERALGRTQHAHSRICACGRCPLSPPRDRDAEAERRLARAAPPWLASLQEKIPRDDEPQAEAAAESRLGLEWLFGVPGWEEEGV